MSQSQASLSAATAPADTSSSSSSLSSPPSSSSVDARPPCLDASALSPAEYPQFLKWRKCIQASPSGVEGLLDEQDALAWLRRECAVGRVDEVKILSLFDRYPLGLEPGHFYALLRLTAWLQQGVAPARHLIFSQTSPATTGLKQGTVFPLTTTAATATVTASPTTPLPPPPQHPRNVSLSAATTSPPSTSTLPHHTSPPAAQPTSSKVPPPPSNAPPQVPAESSKPRFTNKPVVATPTPALVDAPSTPMASARAESPSNPFRSSKPKVYRPTPMIATPSNPNPTASVLDDSHLRPASSIDDGGAAGAQGGFPPLPPRPHDKQVPPPPPPLPPRAHISPLIQAGLQASMQVRKQKDALPPKTFTVLTSSHSRQKSSSTSISGPTTRLLTGETVPFGQQAELLPPPPTHFAKRKVSGHESKRSISDAHSQMKRGPSDDNNEDGGGAGGGPQRAVSGSATVIAAPKPSRPGNSRHRHHHHATASSSSHTASHIASTAAAHVAAPKAQYAAGTAGASSSRAKPNLPSWLREQEELQRSALIEGRPLSPPPSAGDLSHHRRSVVDDDDSEEADRSGATLRSDLERSRRATTVLDEEFDVVPSELRDQASRAASIDRPHNPFIHRSSQVEAEKMKIQPLPARSPAVPSSGGDANRPLGRSKTLHGKAPPPPPPAPVSTPSAALALAARRRLESFPATLDSGTFAGFSRQSTTQGGLRLMPPSAKADVGLGDVVKRPIARRDSSALSLGSSSRSSGAAPMSHPDEEDDSGDYSLASTTPTSHEREQQQQRQGQQGGKKSTTAGADSGLHSITSRVSDFLKLQDAPPKGQRPIDDLKRDAMRLAERRGWIKRNGEGERLLSGRGKDSAARVIPPSRTGDDTEPDVDGGVVTGDVGDAGSDDDDGRDIFDDAPMPDDDAYGGRGRDGRDGDATPTVGGEGDANANAAPPMPRRTPPILPPKRANTMVSATAAAPVARRPSGYVARRASRIEEREGRAADDDNVFGGGGGGGGAAGLGRAASFSVRRTSHAQHRSGSYGPSGAAGGGGSGNSATAAGLPSASGNVAKRASWLEGIDARRRIASEGRAGGGVVVDDDDDEEEGEGGGDAPAGWERLR